MLAFGAYGLVSYRNSSNQKAYERAMVDTIRSQHRLDVTCEEVKVTPKEPEDKLTDWFGEDCPSLEQNDATAAPQSTSQVSFDISDDVDDEEQEEATDTDTTDNVMNFTMELLSGFENKMSSTVDLELAHLHVQTMGATRILANRSDLKGRVALLSPQDWIVESTSAATQLEFDDDFGLSAPEPDHWSKGLVTFLKLAVGEGLLGFALCSLHNGLGRNLQSEEIEEMAKVIKVTLEELGAGHLPIWHLFGDDATTMMQTRCVLRIVSSESVVPAEVFALPAGREGLYESEWLPEGAYLNSLEEKARSLVDLMTTASTKASTVSVSATAKSWAMSWFNNDTEPFSEKTIDEDIVETKEEMSNRRKQLSLYLESRLMN